MRSVRLGFQSFVASIVLIAGLAACSTSAPTSPRAASAPSAATTSETADTASASAAMASDVPADSLISSGPMVGYGTHREVALWVQTKEAVDVSVRYWAVTSEAREANEGVIPDPDTLTTEVVRASDAKDNIARFTITALEPGNEYRYEVSVNGNVISPDHPLRFQTQPLWEWRTDPPAFTVAVGSCTYVNETVYDRPGRPYGGDYRIFESIEALNPDVMVWTGDNVYYREVDWDTPSMMRHRYRHDRSMPQMQALLAHTHNYATWDDHDYGPNNSDRSYGQKEAALEIFKDYWANETYGRPDVPGVFGSFTWGDAEFFLLDNRYHRSPTSAPQSEAKTMWGEAQLQWLTDALTFSDATFKIIVNGGQILNPSGFFETAVRYPSDRSRLLDVIQERRIDGVMLLSGDRHFTELARWTPDGFYPIYEFTSSPMTAGAGGPADGEENPYRIQETLVTERNFGTLSFAGPRRDRTLTLRTYDTDGNELWSRTVRAQDLQLPDADDE